jgi:hypothetical protein
LFFLLAHPLDVLRYRGPLLVCKLVGIAAREVFDEGIDLPYMTGGSCYLSFL